MRDDGQFLVIGFASGDIPKLPANQVLLRNRRVTGVEWGGWVAKNPEANARLVEQVVAMIAAGELHPVEPTATRSTRPRRPSPTSRTARSSAKPCWSF